MFVIFFITTLYQVSASSLDRYIISNMNNQKSKKEQYLDSVPFYRKSVGKVNDEYGDSILPELLLVITFVISTIAWLNTKDQFGGIATLLVWLVLVTQLFTLALANLRTMLLPNKLLKTLGGTVALFVIVNYISQNDRGIITSSIIGSLAIGISLYIVFQLTQGRWIGGGDVKFGFIAGLLLGWRSGLLSIGLVLIWLFLTAVIGKIGAKFSDNFELPSRVGTGVLWATTIIVTMLFGHQLLSLI